MDAYHCLLGHGSMIEVQLKMGLLTPIFFQWNKKKKHLVMLPTISQTKGSKSSPHQKGLLNTSTGSQFYYEISRIDPIVGLVLKMSNKVTFRSLKWSNH